ERKERRGFASMSPEKQREIASKGGRAAHEKGTAHEWSAEEARSAGRKGGQVSRGGRGRLIVPSPDTPTSVEDAVVSSASSAERETTWRRPTMARRVAVAWAPGLMLVWLLGAAATARAQSGSSGTSTAQSTAVSPQPSSSSAATQETRPATTTFFGDTGLWYV